MNQENIGCVFYRKGDEPGMLLSIWCHQSAGSGTGKAWGGPENGFTGHYRIEYFDENGASLVVRDLDITKNGHHYLLTWSHHGVVTGRGTGFKVADGLAAGWHDVKAPSH